MQLNICSCIVETLTLIKIINFINSLILFCVLLTHNYLIPNSKFDLGKLS